MPRARRNARHGSLLTVGAEHAAACRWLRGKARSAPPNGNVGGCPVLALSGHANDAQGCPLSGVERTFGSAAAMSANDPHRSSGGIRGTDVTEYFAGVAR